MIPLQKLLFCFFSHAVRHHTKQDHSFLSKILHVCFISASVPRAAQITLLILSNELLAWWGGDNGELILIRGQDLRTGGAIGGQTTMNHAVCIGDFDGLGWGARIPKRTRRQDGWALFFGSITTFLFSSFVQSGALNQTTRQTTKPESQGGNVTAGPPGHT